MKDVREIIFPLMTALSVSHKITGEISPVAFISRYSRISFYILDSVAASLNMCKLSFHRVLGFLPY